MKDLDGLKEDYAAVAKRRRELDPVRKANMQKWSESLFAERNLAPRLGLNLFVEEGDSVAVPYCGRDMVLVPLVIDRIGEKGKVYLIDNSEDVICWLGNRYKEPSVVLVHRAVARCGKAVPENIDTVVARDWRMGGGRDPTKFVNEDDLFRFMAKYLKEGGYFIDNVIIPPIPDYKCEASRNYVAVDSPFDNSAVVRVTRKSVA